MNRKGFAPVLVIGIIALVVIAGAAGWYFFARYNASSAPANGVACTQEAKECPDGSYVGRTGPNCEFAACPIVATTTTATNPSGWQVYTNQQYGFAMEYPSSWILNEINNTNTSSWVEDPDPPMVGGELLMIDVSSSTQIFLGASTNPSDLSDCATGTPRQIGSSTFYELDYSDAALVVSYYNLDYKLSTTTRVMLCNIFLLRRLTRLQTRSQ
jgi:hypothetical protein